MKIKKLIAALLALAMLFALLAGCSVNLTNDKKEDEKTEQSSSSKKDKDKDKDDDDDDDGKDKTGKTGGLSTFFGMNKDKDPEPPVDGPGTVQPEPGTETPGTGTETPGTGTETPGTGTATPEPAKQELPDPFDPDVAYKLDGLKFYDLTVYEAGDEGMAYSWFYAFFQGTDEDYETADQAAISERTRDMLFDDWFTQHMFYADAKSAGWLETWKHCEYVLEPYPFSIIYDISASSELDESAYGLDHSAAMVNDGTLENAWVEGVSGYGVGECVTMEFTQFCICSGIEIYAGYQKSEDLYDKNARPAELLLVFDTPDGIETETITLYDVMDVQDIYFAQWHYAASVTVFIESVYPGTMYEDTVISEMYIF